MVREGPPEPAPPPQHEAYPADKARREIIPRPPGRLIVFVAAVTGVVLLLILSRLFA
jgi:hypothetical protein